MLQWLGQGPSQRILYNDFRNNRYVTVIISREGDHERILSRPIYTVSDDGKHALSLNFARLHAFRPGYGYVAKPCTNAMEPHPKDDGIFYVNMETGESHLIISLDNIVQFSPRADFQDAVHYINHLKFNPSGTRFVFLHRWQDISTARERTRMFTANIDGSEMYLLLDTEMVSHFTWRDEVHLLAWANHCLLGCRYYLLRDRVQDAKIVGDNILTQDGHPTYSNDGRWILTDTYPNAERLRTLILFDTERSQRYDIGQYHAPFCYDGPIRCDLHPRWSNDNSFICFDSVHEGRRNIYTVNVSRIVKG